MKKNPENIKTGLKLRGLRDTLGYTRTRLAVELDLSEKTISQVENGWQRLSAQAMRRVESLAAASSHEYPPPTSGGLAVAESGGDEYNALAIKHVAEIVSDPASQAAVEAMRSAGLPAPAAWEAFITAKLNKRGTP